MWTRMAYFAFTLPDRPGELVNLLSQLADAGINLLGLWGDAPDLSTGRRARVSCVPESAAAFRTFFQSSDLRIEEGRALFYGGADAPGALAAELRRLAAAQVNIHTIECVGFGGRFGCFVWADEQDWRALEELLGSP